MKDEQNKDQRKKTRAEMNAEFERLLRKCTPEQLDAIEKKMLELLEPEQRAKLQAEWKAAE